MKSMVRHRAGELARTADEAANAHKPLRSASAALASIAFSLLDIADAVRQSAPQPQPGLNRGEETP